MANSSPVTKRPVHERRDVRFASVIHFSLGEVNCEWPRFVHRARCSQFESLSLGIHRPYRKRTSPYTRLADLNLRISSWVETHPGLRRLGISHVAYEK